MFSIDDNIHAEKIREKRPFRVLFSMNVHAVANREMSLENARSYVFFCREGGEKTSVYVGLYFIDSDRRFFYAHSGNPFSDTDMAGIEEDARRFAEDLGAVLDEVAFSRMSDSEKDAWVNNLDILSGEKKQVESRDPAAPPGPAGEDIMPQPEPDVQPSPVQAVPEISNPPQAAPVPPVPVQPGRSAHTAPAAVETSPAASCLPQDQPAASATAPAAVRQVRHEQPQGYAGKAPGQRPAGVPAKEEEGPVMEDTAKPAVRTGPVKAPLKTEVRKDIRNASGLISREKEALARLLASF